MRQSKKRTNMGYYAAYTDQLLTALMGLEITARSGAKLDNEAGLQEWCEWTARWKEHRRNLFFIGNGASAAMSSHMSADAAKNGGLKARCLNEPALVTAIGNDLEYRQVFALQLDRYAEKNDALITISSSGNSPNIVAAIEKARSLDMQIVTLSGLKSDNFSRTLGDLNFYIPANRYGLVESAHQALLHCWLDRYLATLGIEM
ncbi:MAG: SIS domain-containing protein [Bdellovibrionales bacterium]|nr:SIS domain-containing protein [Bdellovibrionales bacterium]